MKSRLKLSTKLHPHELETEFRLDALKRDTRQFTITILLALIPITIFMINDFFTFRNIDLFEVIIAGRIIMTVWSLLVIYIIGLVLRSHLGVARKAVTLPRRISLL